MIDVFFSVYGEDANGQELRKAGPGSLRQLQVKKPIILPAVSPLLAPCSRIAAANTYHFSARSSHRFSSCRHVSRQAYPSKAIPQRLSLKDYPLTPVPTSPPHAVLIRQTRRIQVTASSTRVNPVRCAKSPWRTNSAPRAPQPEAFIRDTTIPPSLWAMPTGYAPSARPA